MYGSTSKLGVANRVAGGGGRGGGGNGTQNKRSSLPPPPRSSRPTNRLSLGGGSSNHSRKGGSNPSSIAGPTGGVAVDESFSLVSGKNSNSFAVIMKLAPGLVEELKKAEETGVSSRIRFDPSEVNTTGNVVEVGGKEFKFTWSSDELCDIFEEQQSGEDGNGLLVQSGRCCRKVNVQRILDESTTNHVKMRSEEAERKLKSRRAIVLDHGNPSMKNQLKQMAAVESSPWKTFKQKKEPPFKKQKTEQSQASFTTKSSLNSTSTSNVAKSRRSSSPLPSPPDQSCMSLLTVASGSSTRGQANNEGFLIPLMRKDAALNSDKEIQAKPASGKDISRPKESLVTQKASNIGKQTDLQTHLISLLKENPKGISFKALEKAVSDAFPNSVTKMEPLLKEIASFQGPGRYFLKPGLDLENFRNVSSEYGSSPDVNHQCGSASHDRDGHNALKAGVEEESRCTNLGDQTQQTLIPIEELNTLENNLQGSPKFLDDKSAFVSSGGRVGSSSDSGSQSDSESESSDSESDSRSHSRSRSPIRSGSGSSSESETDASSNSKEGSDMDVDIMQSDDEKEGEKSVLVSESGFSLPPESWMSTYNAMDEGKNVEHISVGIDDRISDVVDIESHPFHSFEREKRLIDDEKGVVMMQNDGLLDQENVEGPAAYQEMFTGNMFERAESPPDERCSYESLIDRARLKSKVDSRKDLKAFSGDKPERVKQFKLETSYSDQVSRSRQFSASPGNLHVVDNDKAGGMPVNKMEREDNLKFDSEPGYYQTGSMRSETEFHLPWKSLDSEGHGQSNEKSESGKNDGSFVLDRNSLERVDYPKTITSAITGNKDEKSISLDPNSQSQDDLVRNSSDFFARSIAHALPSPSKAIVSEVDKVVNGRTLQRELSDLEQGEFRESFEEIPVNLELERKGELRLSENRTSTSVHANPGSDIGKPSSKTLSDVGKSSPLNLSIGCKTVADHTEKSYSRPRNKAVQLSQKGEFAESGSQSHKIPESTSKLRLNELGIKQGNGTDGHATKIYVNLQKPYMSKCSRVSSSKREDKCHLSGKSHNVVGKVETLSGENTGPSKRDSFSEEDSLSYGKYDKENPDLKGPIQDLSQYKDYVQDYGDKYEAYRALNKILETYRKEFQKMGKDLESVKGRDAERYQKIVSQLKESYSRCGPRHKRLKRIFIVLHEELKNLKKRIREFAVSFSTD